MFNLISKKTSELDPILKNKIFILKKEVWNYPIANQNKWFKKNLKKNDIHNMCFLKKKLVGYTALRKRTLKIDKTSNKYLYFDTFLVKKNYHNIGIGSLLMKFNNFYIRNKNLISFLLCYKKTIKFYKKSGWQILNKQKFKFMDKKNKKLFCMIFPKKKNKNKYYLSINK
jgi:hypothetical protein